LQYADPAQVAQDKHAPVQLGDRVKLSELGRSRFPRAEIDVGTVVHIPKGGKFIKVHFDGNARPTKLHQSYIEPA
jgi:hypothetical protein